jgi:DNA-binding response OmpR family regulator
MSDRCEHARIQRVLVVDDDAIIRDLVAFNLEAEGMTVTTAGDGDTAYGMACVTAPDLIILDVMMPGRDGLSTLGLLRADPRTATIPVALLTARATDDEVWEGWAAGADYYIVKPFDVDEILAFIEYLSRTAPLSST